MGTSLHFSSAFHPQSDGQTERTNQVVQEVLRNFLCIEQQDWDRLIPFVEFAINNAVHSATGETPFYLNYGAHPRVPF